MFRGDYLKRLRKERGLSQTALGKAVGVSGAAIGSYERSTISPPMPQVVKLADFFGVSPSTFWSDTASGGDFSISTQGDMLRILRALGDAARPGTGLLLHMEDLRTLGKSLTFTFTFEPTDDRMATAAQTLYGLLSMQYSGNGVNEVKDGVTAPSAWGDIIDAWMDRNLPELDKIPLTGAEPPAGEE